MMWRRWADYDPHRPVRPWLAAIACHLAIKHLTRRRREVQQPDADRLDDTPLPDDRLASARAQALVLRALAALPDRHRAALTLHEIEGVSVRELAALWSVPLFTAYTRVRAARRAFARVVARLQPRDLRGALAFLSSSKRRSGDKTPPLPAEVRARIQTRVRLLLPPPVLWPAPDGQHASPSPARPPAVPARFRPGKLPPVSVSTLLLGSVPLIAVLAGSIVWSVDRAGATATTRDSSRPLPSHAPAESLHRRGKTPPPRLAGMVPPEDTHGLLGRWSFDDQPGSGVARDSSGHRRDCLLRGSTAGGGRIRGAPRGRARPRRRGLARVSVARPGRPRQLGAHRHRLDRARTVAPRRARHRLARPRPRPWRALLLRPAHREATALQHALGGEPRSSPAPQARPLDARRLHPESGRANTPLPRRGRGRCERRPRDAFSHSSSAL